MKRPAAARRECRAILAEVRKIRSRAAANGCHIAAEWLDVAIKLLLARNAPRRKKEKQESLELHPIEQAQINHELFTAEQ